jgi:hypothetical protein
MFAVMMIFKIASKSKAMPETEGTENFDV